MPRVCPGVEGENLELIGAPPFKRALLHLLNFPAICVDATHVSCRDKIEVSKNSQLRLNIQVDI